MSRAATVVRSIEVFIWPNLWLVELIDVKRDSRHAPPHANSSKEPKLTNGFWELDLKRSGRIHLPVSGDVVGQSLDCSALCSA